jgi:hypothetical protein
MKKLHFALTDQEGLRNFAIFFRKARKIVVQNSKSFKFRICIDTSMHNAHLRLIFYFKMQNLIITMKKSDYFASK